MTRRRRIERVDSAKQELESLMNKINQTSEFVENLVQLWISYTTKTN